MSPVLNKILLVLSRVIGPKAQSRTGAKKICSLIKMVCSFHVSSVPKLIYSCSVSKAAIKMY
jgi:hypothetical protein